MATLATRLNSTGVLQVNGSFDEITYTANKTTANAVYTAELDEVTMQPISIVGANVATYTTGSVWVMDYPSGTQIGDLAIVAFTAKNNFGNDATSSGWTVINRDTSQNNAKAQISYKVITDLNQVTFSKTGATSTGSTAIIIVIRSATYSTFSKAVASTTSNPNPAAVASTGTVIQTLHVDAVAGTTSFTQPSGYTLVNYDLSSGNDATVVAYKLKTAAASEDAGIWQVNSGTTANWVTYSIAVTATQDTVPASRQTSAGKLLVSGSFDEVTGIS